MSLVVNILAHQTGNLICWLGFSFHSSFYHFTFCVIHTFLDVDVVAFTNIPKIHLPVRESLNIVWWWFVSITVHTHTHTCFLPPCQLSIGLISFASKLFIILFIFISSFTKCFFFCVFHSSFNFLCCS